LECKSNVLEEALEDDPFELHGLDLLRGGRVVEGRPSLRVGVGVVIALGVEPLVRPLLESALVPVRRDLSEGQAWGSTSDLYFNSGVEAIPVAEACCTDTRQRGES
jgi:hypothetical protein